MNIANALSALLSVVLVSASLCAQTTTEALAQYASELSAAWVKYPSDQQKIIRTEAIKDAQANWNMNMKTMTVPPNQTPDSVLEVYMSRLKNVPPCLRAEKATAEANRYVAACTAAFQLEVVSCSIPTAMSSAQGCFDWLVQALIVVRKSLPRGSSQQTSSIAAVGNAGRQILNRATPSQSDVASSMAQFEKNVRAISREFPTGSAEQKKNNQRYYQILLGAAKALKNK